MASFTKYSQFEKVYLNDQGALVSSSEHEHLRDVFKFGHNPSVGTSFEVISDAGVYRCPKPSDAVTLRIKAGGNAADDVASTGARYVTLEGLDENGLHVTETLATAGESASLSTTTRFMRLYRAWVSEAGTYVTTLATGGHAAAITIEKTAGSEDWGTLLKGNFADSQTQIGAFSVGMDERAYLQSFHIFVEATKVVDLIVVARKDIMNESSDMRAVRIITQVAAEDTDIQFVFPEPIFLAPGTDIAILGRHASATAKVSTQMTFLLSNAGF